MLRRGQEMPISHQPAPETFPAAAWGTAYPLAPRWGMLKLRQSNGKTSGVIFGSFSSWKCLFRKHMESRDSRSATNQQGPIKGVGDFAP